MHPSCSATAVQPLMGRMEDCNYYIWLLLCCCCTKGILANADTSFVCELTNTMQKNLFNSSIFNILHFQVKKRLHITHKEIFLWIYQQHHSSLCSIRHTDYTNLYTHTYKKDFPVMQPFHILNLGQMHTHRHAQAYMNNTQQSVLFSQETH